MQFIQRPAAISFSFGVVFLFKIYLGLDMAVLISHPAVMATALLMVPLALLLSMMVPGNKVLPVADLAILPSMLAFLVGPSRGNLLRSIIVSCLVVPLFLLISTDLATERGQS